MDFYDLAARAGVDFGAGNGISGGDDLKRYAIGEAYRYGLNASQVLLSNEWPDWAVPKLLEEWSWQQRRTLPLIPVSIPKTPGRIAVEIENLRSQKKEQEQEQQRNEQRNEQRKRQAEATVTATRRARLMQLADTRRKLQELEAEEQQDQKVGERPVRVFDL